jgi:maltooligosyltrehalose synthase
VTARTLAVRRRNAVAISQGAYIPVAARGPAEQRAVALLRHSGDQAVLACVGRFFTRQAEGWSNTVLALAPEFPSGRYDDAISGRSFELEARSELALAELFTVLPCALLERRR